MICGGEMYVCNPSGSRSNQSGSRKNGSRSSTFLPFNSGIFSFSISSLNSGIFSSSLNSLSPLNSPSFSLFTLNKSVGSPGTMSAPTTFSLDQSDNTSRKGPGKFFRSSGVCLTQTLYSSPVPLNFAPVDNIACLS